MYVSKRSPKGGREGSRTHAPVMPREACSGPGARSPGSRARADETLDTCSPSHLVRASRCVLRLRRILGAMPGTSYSKCMPSGTVQRPPQLKPWRRHHGDETRVLVRRGAVRDSAAALMSTAPPHEWCEMAAVGMRITIRDVVASRVAMDQPCQVPPTQLLHGGGRGPKTTRVTGGGAEQRDGSRRRGVGARTSRPSGGSRAARDTGAPRTLRIPPSSAPRPGGVRLASEPGVTRRSHADGISAGRPRRWIFAASASDSVGCPSSATGRTDRGGRAIGPRRRARPAARSTTRRSSGTTAPTVTRRAVVEDHAIADRSRGARRWFSPGRRDPWRARKTSPSRYAPGMNGARSRPLHGERVQRRPERSRAGRSTIVPLGAHRPHHPGGLASDHHGRDTPGSPWSLGVRPWGRPPMRHARYAGGSQVRAIDGLCRRRRSSTVTREPTQRTSTTANFSVNLSGALDLPVCVDARQGYEAAAGIGRYPLAAGCSRRSESRSAELGGLTGESGRDGSAIGSVPARRTARGVARC